MNCSYIVRNPLPSTRYKTYGDNIPKPKQTNPQVLADDSHHSKSRTDPYKNFYYDGTDTQNGSMEKSHSSTNQHQNKYCVLARNSSVSSSVHKRNEAISGVGSSLPPLLLKITHTNDLQVTSKGDPAANHGQGNDGGSVDGIDPFTASSSASHSRNHADTCKKSSSQSNHPDIHDYLTYDRHRQHNTQHSGCKAQNRDHNANSVDTLSSCSADSIPRCNDLFFVEQQPKPRPVLHDTGTKRGYPGSCDTDNRSDSQSALVPLCPRAAQLVRRLQEQHQQRLRTPNLRLLNDVGCDVPNVTPDIQVDLRRRQKSQSHCRMMALLDENSHHLTSVSSRSGNFSRASRQMQSRKQLFPYQILFRYDHLIQKKIRRCRSHICNIDGASLTQCIHQDQNVLSHNSNYDMKNDQQRGTNSDYIYYDINKVLRFEKKNCVIMPGSSSSYIQTLLCDEINEYFTSYHNAHQNTGREHRAVSASLHNPGTNAFQEETAPASSLFSSQVAAESVLDPKWYRLCLYSYEVSASTGNNNSYERSDGMLNKSSDRDDHLLSFSTTQKQLLCRQCGQRLDLYSRNCGNSSESCNGNSCSSSSLAHESYEEIESNQLRLVVALRPEADVHAFIEEYYYFQQKQDRRNIFSEGASVSPQRMSVMRDVTTAATYLQEVSCTTKLLLVLEPLKDVYFCRLKTFFFRSRVYLADHELLHFLTNYQFLLKELIRLVRFYQWHGMYYDPRVDSNQSINHSDNERRKQVKKTDHDIIVTLYKYGPRAPEAGGYPHLWSLLEGKYGPCPPEVYLV